MTYKEIAEIIESIGFPFVYYQFPQGNVPQLPYVIYYYPNSENFGADDHVYQNIQNLNIEVYTKEKDFAVEKQVEDVLNKHFLFWNKNESYITSENMYEVIYETGGLIDGEQD